MSMKQGKRKVKITLTIIIVFWLCVFAILNGKKNSKEIITYNEVIKSLNNEEIVEIKVMSRNIEVVMKDGTEKNAKVPNNTEFINFVSDKIQKGLSDVRIEVKDGIDLSSIFSFISFFCCISVIVFILKQTKGGKFDIKSSIANVTFNDVAGIEEVREQIEDIIEYFKDPKKYANIGAKVPKGVLLSGEPGNGKTLLAKAMSGEAGVKFFQVTGSSFEERLVGVGASRVRKLFDEAKKNAPAIIFIDEIDSIAKKRYSKNSDNEQTLNQLLAEMDGFESNDNVVVIAATNHIEVLDKAILRPGRFDRIVYIPNPDVRTRELILELHARNKNVSPEVSFRTIAQKTVGFSGAELKNILNEAAIYSVKVGRDNITNKAIEEAIAKVMVGLKNKNAVISPNENHLRAIHEAGHAVVSYVLRPEIKIFCISIINRGRTGGYNFFDESKKIYQKEDLLKRMQVLYGGRVAEEIILKDISIGASNDLKRATWIALQMTVKYGMNNSLLVKTEEDSEYNKIIESKAIEKVNTICEKMYKETQNIVNKHKSCIEKLANILEKKEYLNEYEVRKFMMKNLT